VAANATPTSISGFPLSTGNVLSYSVTGLASDSTYYYTVSPQNNSSIKTDAITVRTLLANALTNIDGNKVSWNALEGGIQLKGLPGNCTVSMFDFTGKLVQMRTLNANNHYFEIQNKGIYILQIQTENKRASLKIAY